MPPREANARIRINRLLEEAGWRFDSEHGKANIFLENHVKYKQHSLDALASAW